ncbi:hypothetical protein OKW30_003491 [Paraburkholderia sp. Clong3]|uniref:hypothetical protein n=1 Tax=Paraburkholderia sp. Clong3 TaxID=2991061 RepID=UPI003D21B811
MSESSFAVLALKNDRWSVDLSTYQRWISIRDNIVRSRMVVHGLLDANLLNGRSELLVVGAGVAGTSAAIAAAAQRVPTTLIDSNYFPFATQLKCSTRSLSPYEYDWPHVNWDWDQYPSDFHRVAEYDWLDWPVFSRQKKMGLLDSLYLLGTKSAQAHAADLVGQLQVFMQRHPGGAYLQFHGNTKLVRSTWDKATKKHVTTFRHLLPYDDQLVRKFNKNALPLKSNRFDFLINATGYGTEDSTWPCAAGSPFPIPSDLSKSFWQNDTLCDRFLGHGEPPRVLIIGNGDGALQDLWRSIVRPEVAKVASDILGILTNEIKSQAANGVDFLESMHRKLSLAEEQALRAQYWHISTNDREKIWEALDRIYSESVNDLWNRFQSTMTKTMRGLIRDDAPKLVTIVANTPLPCKVYGLNRFVFHLLSTTVAKLASTRIQVLYDEKTSLRALNLSGGPYELVLSREGELRHPDAVKSAEYDLVIVRTGPKSPPRLVNTRHSHIRQAIGWVPAPFTSIR